MLRWHVEAEVFGFFSLFWNQTVDWEEHLKSPAKSALHRANRSKYRISQTVTTLSLLALAIQKAYRRTLYGIKSYRYIIWRFYHWGDMVRCHDFQRFVKVFILQLVIRKLFGEGWRVFSISFIFICNVFGLPERHLMSLAHRQWPLIAADKNDSQTNTVKPLYTDAVVITGVLCR